MITADIDPPRGQGTTNPRRVNLITDSGAHASFEPRQRGPMGPQVHDKPDRKPVDRTFASDPIRPPDATVKTIAPGWIVNQNTMCVPRLPGRKSPRVPSGEVRVMAKRLATVLMVFTSFGLAACSGGVSGAGPLKPTVPLSPGRPGAPVVSSQKHPVGPSPNMVMSLSPTRGPAGTTVTIKALACLDPAGGNHAVSFNRAAGPGGNMTDGRNPNNVVGIPATLSGTTLTGSYTITHQDTAFGGGVFFVQCGQTLKTILFTATGQ